MNILITGGTTFVSKFAAEYFVEKKIMLPSSTVEADLRFPVQT